MRANMLWYGRLPADPATVVWRAFNRYEVATTIAHGSLQVSLAIHPELPLLDTLREKQPELWNNIEECYQAPRPPASQVCGRLYCPDGGRHGHRAWKPGDLFALVDWDPADNTPEGWLFPRWGVVAVPSEDDADKDGICVEIGADKYRRFLEPGKIRRLRPAEIVVGASTW